MSKGRKNGCPTNVKDWDISIQDKAQDEETWVRIKGLTEINRSTDSDTEDGSASTDTWSEPYITKRSGSLALSGTPLVDAATGEQDAGQAMLDDYATSGQCDEDATIKIVDPYGKAIVCDYIVTGTEDSTGEDGDERSWDLEQVGEAEPLPYVQVTGVTLKDGNSAVTTLSMAVGAAAKIITVNFAPADASNQRYKINVSNKRVVSVGNVTDGSFTITPLSAGTAKVKVTSVNNAKSATITVTVTAP
ncbi:MAG: hypothetical protein E7327_08865 [Clostridiales bacterium]|nr:hypothetical protein [Clostridiales bacterium]